MPFLRAGPAAQAHSGAPGQPSFPTAPGRPPAKQKHFIKLLLKGEELPDKVAESGRGYTLSGARFCCQKCRQVPTWSAAVLSRGASWSGWHVGWAGAMWCGEEPSAQGCLVSRPPLLPLPPPGRSPQASRWTPTRRRPVPTASSQTSSTVSLMCCPPAGLTKPLVDCWVSTRRVDHACIRHAHLQPAPRLQAATPCPILLPCRPLCGMQASAPRAR